MIARLFLTTASLAISAPVLAQTGNQAGMTTSGAPATGSSTTAGTTQATGTGSTMGTGATAGGGVAQGATVYDPQGGTVGTVQSINGNMAVVATQRNRVQLPMSSFAKGPKGPVIAMTAAQLDQAASQAAPTQTGAPNVTQGAAVTDTKGGAVGTVSEVDGQFATVTLTTGSKVRLPLNAFGAGQNGGLRVAMTAAQLSAAGAAAGDGTPASTSGTTPTSSGGQ